MRTQSFIGLFFSGKHFQRKIISAGGIVGFFFFPFLRVSGENVLGSVPVDNVELSTEKTILSSGSSKVGSAE